MRRLLATTLILVLAHKAHGQTQVYCGRGQPIVTSVRVVPVHHTTTMYHQPVVNAGGIVTPHPVVYPARYTSYPRTVAPTMPAFRQEARRPLLAAVALSSGPYWAPGAPPPLFSGQPIASGLPRGVNLAATGLSYIGRPYSYIGVAIPPAIRTTHVLLNGSPYPGQPIRTAMWIGFPLATRLTDGVRESRGLFGLR